jgi:hypothetical protein
MTALTFSMVFVDLNNFPVLPNTCFYDRNSLNNNIKCSCMSVNLGHAFAVGRTLTSKNDDTVVAFDTNPQSFNTNNDALSLVRGEANSAKPLPKQV